MGYAPGEIKAYNFTLKPVFKKSFLTGKESHTYLMSGSLIIGKMTIPTCPNRKVAKARSVSKAFALTADFIPYHVGKMNEGDDRKQSVPRHFKASNTSCDKPNLGRENGEAGIVKKGCNNGGPASGRFAGCLLPTATSHTNL